MKKLLSLSLVLLVALSLIGCTKGNVTGDKEEGTASKTVGATLLSDFNEKATEFSTALEIAEAVSQNSVIEFMPMTMEVEPGYLNGFDAEITGFTEGAMFGPSISTIPFIGYVFVLENEEATEGFLETLNENANLRWNVCTEAEEAVSGIVDNKVFFVMTNKSFEE